MDVSHEKDAASKTGKQGLHSLAIEVPLGPGSCPFKTLKAPSLVALRLQPADEPGSGVREALVVEVYRVLRGQDYPKAECPRLLEKSEQRELRRWVCHRGK